MHTRLRSFVRLGVALVVLPSLFAVIAAGTGIPAVRRAVADDDTKQNTVAFFMQTGCPTGWSVYTPAQGRLLLGVTDSTKFTIGNQGGGDALGDQEDRTHTHGYQTTVNLSTKDIEADSSCCNKDGASPGDKDVPSSPPGTTGAASSNTPLAQLTVCEKTDPPTDTAAADPYPMGALAFFDAPSCPVGNDATNPDWQVASLGGSDLGYFVVPFYDPPAATLGAVAGTGLSPGEDRTHSHAFASSIDVSGTEFAGKWGCVSWLGLCAGITSDGTKSFSGTSASASSGLPYVTLLMCQKASFSINDNPPPDVPQSVVAFFTDQTCPTGWKLTEATTGRYLVGLPAGGIPGATFGGDPLKPTEDTPTPFATHTHTFTGSVSTGDKEIALASGSGADGAGAAGTYTYQGTTDAASAGLPYLGVIQCQPCTVDDPDQSCQTQ